MDDRKGMSFAQDLAFAVLFGVVLVFNIAGNSLVIYIITNERGMKTSTNYLLLNLAVADLLFGIFVLPQSALMQFIEHPNGIFGDWLCKLLTGNSNIGAVIIYASLLTSLTLCFERYFAVCHPYSFRQRFSPRKVKILMAASWALGVIGFPFLVAYTYFDENDSRCRYDPSFLKGTAIFASLEILLVSFLITFLFIKTAFNLWCKQTVEPTGQREITERKKKKKVTLCVLAVVVTFAVCWIPAHVTFAYSAFCPDFDETEIGVKITILLIAVNAALDPYLYSFQSPRFSSLAKKIICCEKIIKVPHVSMEQATDAH